MGGVRRRKMVKRLKARLRAWEDHGEYPVKNPGKESGPMRLHRPGGKR